MSNEKVVRLVEAVAKKTQGGMLAWKETEFSGVFQTSFPTHSVRISMGPSPNDDSIDVIFQIIDGQGELVEEIRDPELNGKMDKPFTQMHEMYESARRSAKGVDSAIDAILEALSAGTSNP